MTFRIIGMLFSTEPAGGCFLLDGFLLAPLPARKQLWEAREETQWIQENGRGAGDANMFGIKVSGQMAKLNERSTMTKSTVVLSIYPDEVGDAESNANWEQWCSGMDGLGALVMLAASLPI
jgi:hypothetical protein